MLGNCFYQSSITLPRKAELVKLYFIVIIIVMKIEVKLFMGRLFHCTAWRCLLKSA